MILKSLKKNYLAKKSIYNFFTNKKIGVKKCEHVLNVWSKFEMKMMKDYHDLYLKWDVSLLTDVFQKLKNNSLKSYELCPSYDEMLKMTKFKGKVTQIKKALINDCLRGSKVS